MTLAGKPVRKVTAFTATALLTGALGVALASPSAQASTCFTPPSKGPTWGKITNNGCQLVQVRLYRYWGGGVEQNWYGPQSSVSSYASTGGPTVTYYYARVKLSGTWLGWTTF